MRMAELLRATHKELQANPGASFASGVGASLFPAPEPEPDGGAADA